MTTCTTSRPRPNSRPETRASDFAGCVPHAGAGSNEISGLRKAFSIRESMKLQFRSEFFNCTSQTNFGLPGATSNSTSFGQIRTTYPARQIQFALKLRY